MKLDSRARKIFKKFPRDVRDYFYNLDKKCQKHSITLTLGGGEQVNFGYGRCGGYFDDSGKVLKVAIKGSIESVMAVALHESSHLDQKISNNSVWYNSTVVSGFNRFFKYLEGQKIYKLDHAVQCAIALEKDCEQRAIQKIKKHWLHRINLDKYKANASAYLYSYLYMAKKGKWTKSPCIAKIRAHCPNKILRKYSEIPERLEMAFDRYL